MRAKRGEPGAVEATNKWRATMQAKYGENWREKMRELGRKGGANGHTGGFYGNPEKAREAGRKGGSVTKAMIEARAKAKSQK